MMPAPTESSPFSPLASLRELRWAGLAAAAAFGTYFCMYAFRKPFTAATFEGVVYGGLGFKTILVTSQVTGYLFSKILGIRFVSQLAPARRAWTIIGLILAAELALLLFAVVPRPWNAACLFFNGLPLGMVFGLVLGFLEGRRLTEALAAGLCASFIVADGVTKSVGATLLARGVTEEWMPALAGALFLAPLALCVTLLALTPPPSDSDRLARSQRYPMQRADRRAFLARNGRAVLPLVVLYLAVTVVRSIRADFAPEIWNELGRDMAPSLYTRSELWVAFGVLVVNGAAIFIRDNRKGYLASLATCTFGVALLAIAVSGQSFGLIADLPFMVLLGLGLYSPYVAIHTTTFERYLALTRERANVGFLMHLADACGYLGYTAVMIVGSLRDARGDVLSLLKLACWVTVVVSSVCLVIAVRESLRARGSREPVLPHHTVETIA